MHLQKKSNDNVHIDAGIWSVSVCTVDRLCLDTKLCEAETLFGFQAMFTPNFGMFIFAKTRLHDDDTPVKYTAIYHCCKK